MDTTLPNDDLRQANTDAPSIITPPPHTPVLTLAQKQRIAANKAKALAIKRANGGKMMKETVFCPTAPKVNGTHLPIVTVIHWQYCAICHKLMNPYRKGAMSAQEIPEAMCEDCIANITFSQDSFITENR
jgi:hypothetical protein